MFWQPKCVVPAKTAPIWSAFMTFLQKLRYMLKPLNYNTFHQETKKRQRKIKIKPKSTTHYVIDQSFKCNIHVFYLMLLCNQFVQSTFVTQLSISRNILFVNPGTLGKQIHLHNGQCARLQHPAKWSSLYNSPRVTFFFSSVNYHTFVILQ